VAKAAPFKRNDQMLDVLPIGVMLFPGNGIQENLGDKARKLGIPVWKFGTGGASAPPTAGEQSLDGSAIPAFFEP
jgi:hypothetical protein